MTTDSVQRQVLEIERCPRCGAAHRFELSLRVSVPQPPAVPLFGGPGAAGESGIQEIGLTCPATGQLFPRRVSTPPEAEILEVVEVGARPEPAEPGPSPAAAGGAMDGEYAAWIQSSRATATDFCQLMVNTTIGAIPVYFAVLGYLGTERIRGTLLGRATIIPPVIFLVAGLLFVLALRPQFAAVTEAGFAAFRADRLRRLNAYIVAGVALFTLGAALSIVLFFRALP